jgi:1,4-dihydroxy-2-naphthoyl-CoA hydrolase
MKYTYRIKLADTDAAGRIYVASAVRIAHESFEHVMDVIGFGADRIIAKSPFILPVVRVEADYRRALALGETVTADTRIEKIGKRSVTFAHRIDNAKGSLAVRVLITHAAVSKKTGRAVPLPPALKKAFGRI